MHSNYPKVHDIVVVEIHSYFKILDPRTGKVIEEIFNDDPAYKDDFKYSYGNDKQGIEITDIGNFETGRLRKCSQKPSDRTRTCGPVIPVRCSNH